MITVGHFTSVAQAIAGTQDALACDPAAVELMGRTILDLSRRTIEYAALGDLLEGEPEALLFVSFTGEEEGELLDRMRQLTKLWSRHGHGYHTLQAVTPAQQSSLLKVRKAGLGVLMAASEGTRRPLAFGEDTAALRLGRREWAMSWLTGYHRLNHRYERQPHNYLAVLGLATALCCYRGFARLTTWDTVLRV